MYGTPASSHRTGRCEITSIGEMLPAITQNPFRSLRSAFTTCSVAVGRQWGDEQPLCVCAEASHQPWCTHKSARNPRPAASKQSYVQSLGYRKTRHHRCLIAQVAAQG